MKIARAFQNAVLDTAIYAAATILVLWLRSDDLLEFLSKYRVEAFVIGLSVAIAVFIAIILGVTTLRDFLNWQFKGRSRNRMPGTIAVAAIVGLVAFVVLIVYHQQEGVK